MNQIFVNMSCKQMIKSFNVDTNVSPQLNITLEPIQYSSTPSSSSGEYSPTPPTQSLTHLMANNSMTGRMITKSVATFENNPTFDPIRYKTEMCKNFQELGVCKYGNNCYYAHWVHELKPVTHKHKKYRTVLCKPFHLEGFCDFGSRCAFIHSKPDVRQIVDHFHTFLCSAPPMTDITDYSDRTPKPKSDKRLNVFKRISQN